MGLNKDWKPPEGTPDFIDYSVDIHPHGGNIPMGTNLIEIKAGPELDRAVEDALPLEDGWAYCACSLCGRGKFDRYTLADTMFCECPRPDGGPIPRFGPAPFRPSTDLNAAIAAAEMVGLFHPSTPWVQLFAAVKRGTTLVWFVGEFADWMDSGRFLGMGETPALAICAAILKLAEKKTRDLFLDATYHFIEQNNRDPNRVPN